MKSLLIKKPGGYFGDDDVNPMDGLANLADIMLIFAIGIMLALVNGMTDPDCPKVIGDASYIKSVAYPDTMLVGAGGGNVSDTVYGSEVDFAYKTACRGFKSFCPCHINHL